MPNPDSSALPKTTIPKIIHYIWVGGKPLSPLAERCLASWKTHLPDYELRLWNELNSPMDHPYVQEMYAQKKWAFVSDYIRFWALKNEGGLYLDTDMEVLKPLDGLLATVSGSGFVGTSQSDQIESSIIGAVPHADFIDQALNFYNTTTIYTIRDTSPLVLSGAVTQTKAGVTVFPSQYFFPCAEGERCSPKKLAQAYARHHWAESWVPYARTRKVLRRMGIWSVLKKILK
jgi:mannosyltransferase OCH1-like enzyme